MRRTEVYDPSQPRCVPIKWHLRGFDNYGIAANRKMYNLLTGMEVRQVIKGGYTRGFNLSGKFYSLRQLRPLLVPLS